MTLRSERSIIDQKLVVKGTYKSDTNTIHFNDGLTYPLRGNFLRSLKTQHSVEKEINIWAVKKGYIEITERIRVV